MVCVDVDRFQHVQRETRDQDQGVCDSKGPQQYGRSGRFGRLIAAEVKHDERQSVPDQTERTQRTANYCVQDAVKEGTVRCQNTAKCTVAANDAAVSSSWNRRQRRASIAQILRRQLHDVTLRQLR